MNMFSGCGGASSYSYRLFISHAWDYDGHYEGIKHLLNQDSDFQWEDLSVPFDDPLNHSPSFPRSYGAIVDQLRERIRKADALLVIAGMYCAHRGWIQTEMEAAKQYGIPVIAVRPWGQERLPEVIKEVDIDVGWRTFSLVNEIRKRTIPRPPRVAPQNILMGPFAKRVLHSMLSSEPIGRDNLVPPVGFSSEPLGVGSLQKLANADASGGRDNSQATSTLATYISSSRGRS